MITELLHRFTIPGDPHAKHRPRVAHEGKRATIHKAPEDRSAEKRVAFIARQAGVRPIDGPVAIDMAFAMPMAPSWPNSKRAAMAGQPHAQRPDLDNLIKWVLDGLNGTAWQDDGQVCAINAHAYWTAEPVGHTTVTIGQPVFRPARGARALPAADGPENGEGPDSAAQRAAGELVPVSACCPVCWAPPGEVHDPLCRQPAAPVPLPPEAKAAPLGTACGECRRSPGQPHQSWCPDAPGIVQAPKEITPVAVPVFDTPHEAMCFRTAVMFTAVRGRGFNRTRTEHASFAEACAAGTGDGRTMIYAVNAAGNHAHIRNV